jgi:CO dehydrogenase nickel-insertion accessory protein CooC1
MQQLQKGVIMNPIKIGICGCHGAGKTTKAKELSAHYADAGKVVLVVDEVARSCLHTLGTIEAQEWIWHEQMAREKYAMTRDADVMYLIMIAGG